MLVAFILVALLLLSLLLLLFPGGEVGGIRLEPSPSFFLARKSRSRASLCWYVREKQRGTVSTRLIFQTLLFEQLLFIYFYVFFVMLCFLFYVLFIVYDISFV